MSTFSKFLTLAAATVVAFVGSASAQIVTFQTLSSYSGGVQPIAGGAQQGETFTNVSAVTSITYNFFANGTELNPTNLSATFGEWNGSSFVGGTTVSFGSIVIPPSGTGGWGSFGSYATYAATFDLTSLAGSYPSLVDGTYGYLTSPSSTYALIVTNTGASSNVGLGLILSDVFPYGATNFGFGEWAFSQVAYVPNGNSLVPVPESSTVASIAVGAMVFGLVGYRTYQRRRVAAAPVVAA